MSFPFILPGSDGGSLLSWSRFQAENAAQQRISQNRRFVLRNVRSFLENDHPPSFHIFFFNSCFTIHAIRFSAINPKLPRSPHLLCCHKTELARIYYEHPVQLGVYFNQAVPYWWENMASPRYWICRLLISHLDCLDIYYPVGSRRGDS